MVNVVTLRMGCAAAVLVAAADGRSPPNYQLMFDHSETKCGKKYNGGVSRDDEQAPDATRADQRTLTLFHQ